MSDVSLMALTLFRGSWDPGMLSRRKSLYSVLENEEVFSRHIQVGWSPKVDTRSRSRLEVRGAHGSLEDQQGTLVSIEVCRE